MVDRAQHLRLWHRGSPPLVVAFTSTGRGECIAYSNDRGRTWTEYAGNPVVRHAGRDPRLLWHEPTKRWVMAVYDETGGARSIAFHSSPDLKTWRFESRIDGFFECPELFELPVDGDCPARRLWVLYAADGEYRLGQFDGQRFAPETGKLRVWYGNFYASQTFSDAPDGRRIQIGWANGIAFPGEPFNQQMTVPCELTLRPTPRESGCSPGRWPSCPLRRKTASMPWLLVPATIRFPDWRATCSKSASRPRSATAASLFMFVAHGRATTRSRSP